MAINKNTDFSKWNSKESCFKKYDNVSTKLIYGKHNNRAKVSIIILSYRRVEGLINALESALDQDYDDIYEILVMDDSGMKTEIDSVMKEYCSKYDNIIYYRHVENIGEPGNWNRSCEICKTPWYCLLHDDDRMKRNYLSEMMKVVNRTKNEYGLIGVYVDFDDQRKAKPEKGRIRKIFEGLINLFLILRKGRIIPITLKDNMRDIYAISTCLFLNKEKVMKVGGSEDAYFPNSDSVFNSKMNYYYKIGFLPQVLATRGVYDNQSLKQEVCNNAIRASYYHTYEMAKTLNFKDGKARRKASVCAVIHEIMVRGYNNINYGFIKQELGMKKIYKNKLIIFLINLYSKFCWGKFLFRKG